MCNYPFTSNKDPLWQACLVLRWIVFHLLEISFSAYYTNNKIKSNIIIMFTCVHLVSIISQFDIRSIFIFLPEKCINSN